MATAYLQLMTATTDQNKKVMEYTPPDLDQWSEKPALLLPVIWFQWDNCVAWMEGWSHEISAKTLPTSIHRLGGKAPKLPWLFEYRSEIKLPFCRTQYSFYGEKALISWVEKWSRELLTFRN
jgi:hypothetical protein